MFKKSLLIGSLAFLAMFGISQPANSSPIAKEFIVGVDDDYPPFDFFDEKGEATGFDVDLIRAIADKQQLALRFVPTHWNNIVENLDNKKIQLALSGFAYSDERAKKYQVSNTYAYGQDVIATLDGGTVVQNYADLKNHRVLTLADSPYIPQLEEVMGKGNANLIGEKSTFLVVKNLINKKAEVAFIDKGTMQYYVQSFPDMKVNMLDSGSPELEPYELVMLANKQEGELMAKINAGLSQIVQDGTYATIYKKWFGVEPAELPK